MICEDQVRVDTPASLTTVFLDSAGSSIPPQPVVDMVVGHLRREAEVGGYRAMDERAADLAGVKSSIARLLGCAEGSVALADSATRAWGTAFYAVPLRPGDRVLLTGVEYASNAVAALQRAGATDASVEYVPSDGAGQLDLAALESMLDERVALVSLVHVPTNGGLINPVETVVKLAHRVGALVFLDACQSIGQLVVEPGMLGVDMLSATGRKWLRGPRGTGFLYLSPELVTRLEPPMIDLHGAAWESPHEYRLRPDATRFELWETDVAARLGLGAAVNYLLELGVPDVVAAVAERSVRLRRALAEIPNVRVRDLGYQQCGIVSFTVDGVAPSTVRDALAEQDITVTVSGRPSTLLDMTARNLTAVVRASPHYFVSLDQIDRAADAVAQLAAHY